MALSSTFAGLYSGSLTTLASDLGLGPVADWLIDDLTAPASLDGPSQRWHEHFILSAPSLAQAKQWLPLIVGAGKARTVVLLIKEDTESDAPKGQKTPAQLATCPSAAGTAPAGYSATRISTPKWVDVRQALSAAILARTVGRPSLPLKGIRVGLASSNTAAWAAGDKLARLMTPAASSPDDTDIFPVDFVVSDGPVEYPGLRQPAGVLDVSSGRKDESGWSVALPPVDTSSVSPAGFLPYPELGQASAEVVAGGGIRIRNDAGRVIADSRPGEAIGEHLIQVLRDHSYLDVSKLGEGSNGTALEATVAVSAFAVAGIPLLYPNRIRNTSLLGAELLAAVTGFDATDTAVVRESKSINMRRTALQYFAPAARWGSWASRFGRVRQEPARVSVVLATRRPDKLQGAVAQIARQSWPDVEIVLALHGFEVTRQELDVLEAYGRPVVVRQVPADRLLGEVLNAGVQAASGELIAKMDDDDWYGTNHLLDLVLARDHSGAALVGSQVEFVYLEDLDLVTRRPPEGEQYSDHVAGGTMLISAADLRELGGWRPVHRAVDRCLLQAVTSAGGSVYRGHGQNYVMHRYSDAPGHGGHTWAPDSEVFLQNSAEQWSGFLLPPQIDQDAVPYVPRGRSPRLKSVFSQPQH